MAAGMHAAQQDDIPPMREFASHQRQFDRFIHLAKWFVVHIGFALVALYFFLVGAEPVAGSLFLALAVLALGYGIYSTPQVARDVTAAMEHRTDPS